MPIKVAHKVYCGATRMAERSAAIDIIERVLKESRRSNQAQQSANNSATAAQVPFDNHQLVSRRDGKSFFT